MKRSILRTVLAAASSLLVVLVAISTLAPQPLEDGTSAYERALRLFSEQQYAEAEIHAEKAVEMAEAEYGPDSPNTALRLKILAKVYQAQERIREAQSLYRRVLIIFDKTLEPGDPDIVDTLNSLAQTYHAQGRFAEAERLYKQSVAILEKGAKRSYYSFRDEAYMGLGRLYFDQGRAAEAEPLVKRVLSHQSGKEDPFLASTLIFLALIYDDLGRYAEADHLYKRSLAILEKTRGSDHPDVDTVLKLLAAHYLAQGQFTDASEVTAWAQVKNSQEIRGIERFLRDHPQGIFADQAKELLATLRPEPRAPRPPSSGADGEDRTPGRTFKDCAECPEMVIVPAGSFKMGLSESERQAAEKLLRQRLEQTPDEFKMGREAISIKRLNSFGPQHRVNIGYALAVGKYEVTFAEWDACVAAKGCSHRPRDIWARGRGRGRNPVMRVSWIDAKEYLAWLSQKTGKNYHLLSEAEWEYVVRAVTDSDHGNWAQKNVPVGSFPANAFGLHDLNGSVREWVEDCWHDNYLGAPMDGSAWGNCEKRVVRGGGSFLELPFFPTRDHGSADYRSSGLGFRVARNLY